jgi:hypothetical protein
VPHTAQDQNLFFLLHFFIIGVPRSHCIKIKNVTAIHFMLCTNLCDNSCLWKTRFIFIWALCKLSIMLERYEISSQPHERQFFLMRW